MKRVAERTRRVKKSRVSMPANQEWLRSWRQKVNNWKVHSLTDSQYRFWDMTLCLTNANGDLPDIKQISFQLRMSLRDAEQRMVELIDLGFIDPIVGTNGSIAYKPHDWSDWQPHFDTSKQRMQRLRKRRRDGDVTVSDGSRYGECSPLLSSESSLPCQEEDSEVVSGGYVSSKVVR